jgi:release factor glutamine methyltransferase
MGTSTSSSTPSSPITRPKPSSRLADLLAWAAGSLGGCRSGLDVLCAAWGKPAPFVLARTDSPLPAEAYDRFCAAVEKVAAGHPLQYATGGETFWGLRLEVNEDVLIPRPETELLVEQVLALPLPDDARILDVGTGSGAIAAALKRERPSWRVFASDLSLPALRTARRNLAAHGLGVPLFAAENLPEFRAPWDAIVSNPPYIPTEALHLLPENVRREPVTALDGGQEGLEVLFALLRGAQRRLARGGRLVLELGYGQAPRAMTFARRLGYRRVRVVNDYADIGRVLTALWLP